MQTSLMMYEFRWKRNLHFDLLIQTTYIIICWF